MMRPAAASGLIATLLAVAVAACAGGPAAPAPAAPPALAPEVEAAYRAYLAKPGRGAFAVTADGGAAGSSFCEGALDCRGNDVSVALETCRRSGRACYLYDQGGRIVWRGAPGAAASAARPGTVTGVLTSRLEYRPLTARELADPGLADVVARCEKAGLGHCRERQQEADRRRSFAPGPPGGDREVVAVMRLGGLQAGAAYAGVCRFRDPAGGVAATVPVRATAPADLPPDLRLRVRCGMPLGPATPAGAWALEFEVNGERAALLRFEVLRPPQPAPAST